jgi:hypothetical protein
MPWAGFEPAIPISEWPMTVRVLDRAAIVTGRGTRNLYKNSGAKIIEKEIIYKTKTETQYY